MLHAMSRRFFSSHVLFLALALASVGMTACSKDTKTGGDAAADAASDASVADAAADAADGAADATTTPLTTATAVPVKPKAAPPDPAICQKARAAKARNSPSFPALEKECKAAGGSI
jgi:cell division septation protein DedD